MKKIIGIDFGTYNSLCVVNENGRIIIVRHNPESGLSEINNQEDSKEMPSFIYINNNGDVEKVGSEAKKMMSEKPGQVVWGLKRLLGKTYNQLKNEIKRFLFDVEPDIQNGKCLISVNGKTWKPTELMKWLFVRIIQDLETQGIKDYDEVVISVPAYYTPASVSEIIKSAQDGGFEKEKIKTISEPVAGAIANGTCIGEKKSKIFVFDMGCGTLDLSCGYIYKTDDYHYDVLQNIGSRVGGIDIDDCLLRLICSKDRINKDKLGREG